MNLPLPSAAPSRNIVKLFTLKNLAARVEYLTGKFLISAFDVSKLNSWATGNESTLVKSTFGALT